MEQRGELVTIILQYTAGMEVTPPDDLRALWAFVRASIDTNSAKFEEVKAKRAEAGRKGGKQTQANASKLKQTQANASKSSYQYQNQNQNQEQNQYQGSTCVERSKDAREVDEVEKVVVDGRISHAPAPTADEVADYFKSINGTGEQAHRFFDFWETENWTKRSGQRLIAWQAAARQWVLDDFRKNQEKTKENGRDKGHQLAAAGEYTSEF